MILSDKTLSKMIQEKALIAEPLELTQIQPASIDIRLGDTFSVVEDNSSGIIKMDSKTEYKTIKTDTYILLPGQFVLATTMEYFELPDDLTAFVEGRSSLGRMGLFIQNAGWVDPGFKGEITLELFNANRCAIELKSGRRVGQLVFAKMDFPALNPYSGKYQGQRGATGSRVYLDNDLKQAPQHAVTCTEELSKTDTFTDTTNISVLKAYKCGVVNGVGDNLFAPTEITNREQIAAMVFRATEVIKENTGKDLTPVIGSIEKFADKSDISDWAVQSIGELAENGIMNGTSDVTASPKEACTVEQSILLIYRVYKSAV